MNIKERVYTLEPYPKKLYLRWNGRRVYCPFASDPQDGMECGEWCPAFVVYDAIAPSGAVLTRVDLNCFPQHTSFTINQEVKGEDESTNQDETPS